MRRFSIVSLCLSLIIVPLYADQTADAMLFEGISMPSLERVKEAFAKGATPDSRDGHGRRPLAIALQIYSGSKWRAKKFPEKKQSLATDQAIVQEIMNHIKKVSPEDFVAAAGFGERDIIEQMLAKGIDINARNSLGRTALMALLASYDPDLTLVKFFVDKGADINASNRETFGGQQIERNVLDYALKPGSPEQLDAANYLIDKGVHLNPKHFFLAATRAEPNFDLIKKIHKKIKDVDAQGDSKMTPLRFVVIFGQNRDAINYLLDEGADVNASSSVDPESILGNAIKHFYYWPDGPIDLAIIDRMLKSGATIDDKVMALAQGNLNKLIELLGEEEGAPYRDFAQPDSVKKEQVLKLLEQYRKTK